MPLPTYTQIAASLTKFFSASDKAHDIVNGADNATVTVESGVLPTFAKAIKDFQESGGNLTSGPVTSSGGTSAIADGALSIAKTSGLQTALDGKARSTVYNVKDYGALGNNVADDTASIQATINTAKAAGGGLVYLPKGAYRVNKTADTLVGEGKHAITLKSGVSLIGDGPYLTIIKPLDSSLGNMPILFGYPQGGDTRITNVQIRDLQVDGNRSRANVGGGSGNEDEGINFYGGDNILLDNLVVHNNGQDGLDLDAFTGGASKNIVVSNCIFYDNGGAAIHPEIINMMVSNCHFENNGHVRALDPNPAVAAYACAVDATGEDFVITNCTFRNNYVDILANNAKISNCSFLNSNGRTSIKQNLAGTNVISNCRIITTGVGSIGIDINMITGTASDFLVAGNQIIAATAGIRLQNGGGLVVDGNTIGGGTYGVQIVNQNGKRVSVNNNRFSAASTTMVRVEGAGGGQAMGNYSDQTAAVLFDLRGSTTNWIIAGNYGSGAATGVRCFSGGFNTIQNNHFVGGLDIQTASNKIIGNRFATLALTTSQANSNLLEGNEIGGTITHTTVTYASNTWRRNHGAGTTGIFSGTATLASGTATITSPAASSGKKYVFARQSPGSSTAIGTLALGTVTANTSAVINSLDAAATVATGDLSVVAWEITD